jgi:hypothetical protein
VIIRTGSWRQVWRNGIAHSTLFLLIALLPTVAPAMDSGFSPPTAIFLVADFEDGTSPAGINSGSWSVAGGSFNCTSAVPTATATVAEYEVDPIAPPREGMTPTYAFRARMLNQRAAATSLVGVVFEYVDAANYNEAVFAPTGTFAVRQMTNGTSKTVASGTYVGGGQNVWFDVAISRTDSAVQVKAAGNIVATVLDLPPVEGDIGFTAHNTTAKFDKFAAAVPFGEQPWRLDFTSDAGGFSADSGQWSVAGGTFNSSTVQERSVASNGDLFIFVWPEFQTSYMLRARMFNPYKGPGNLMGIYFNNDAEVLFSPTGVAKINLTRNGVTETIATATYAGAPKVWFDVRADIGAGDITVAVDGVTIFDNVSTGEVFEGHGGLVTRWTPGKFDDVWFENRYTFHPLSQTFDSAPPAAWTVSGTWNTSGGTLNNSSLSSSDIVTTACGCWETDFSYRSRLFNQYGNSGNLVGLVYNYQRGGPEYGGLYLGDYYEVVFAPTGQAYLNKVLNGARYRMATGSHSVPPKTFFNVQVLRQGVNTTVKVNGVTVFDKVPQGELPFGDVGVVAHWSKGRFDNWSVRDAPPR